MTKSLRSDLIYMHEWANISITRMVGSNTTLTFAMVF